MATSNNRGKKSPKKVQATGEKTPVHPADREYIDKDKKSHQVVLKIQNSLSLDADEPFPILVNGDLSLYEREEQYIPFLDSKDDLANLLLKTRLNSTTQNACINSISRCLVGTGVVTDYENPDQTLIAWMKNVNNKRQSFAEFLIHTLDGERTFGNQFIEIVRGEFLGKRYMKIYNHSMRFCRLLAPKNFDEPDTVLLSKLIAKQGYSREYEKDAPKIPLWNDGIFAKDVWVKKKNGVKGEQSTMIHFKNEVSGIEHYGLPDSISSIRQQVAEMKAIQFNIDNFENNMILGGMLVFKGGMTHSEALATAQEIMLTHIGDGKTGRIGVVSSEEGLNEVQFIPYNTQREGSFVEFMKAVSEDIIKSHGWDSVLAGENRSSTLGNGSQYIRSIWDVKEAALLTPLRNKMIDKVIKPILTIFADWFQKPEVVEYNIDLKSNMPFSYMAELDPNKFWQVNEARKKAGLENDDSMDGVYLSQIKAPTNANQFTDGFVKTEGDNGGGNPGGKRGSK